MDSIIKSNFIQKHSFRANFASNLIFHGPALGARDQLTLHALLFMF